VSQVGWTAGLAPDITARLVGVIDLRGGQAVHAVAGDRARYRAVPFCSGSVAELVRHYQRLGVKAFYLADLDAIGGGDPDVATIHAVCRSAAATEVVADVGWRGDESAAKRAAIERLSASCPALRWIAATETCRSALAIDELAELVSPARTLL
jgi:phosphoribosylformimino-5-aminoimidazole carboxamide ribotide isomerase